MSVLRWQVGDATILRVAEVDASAAMVGLIDGLDPTALDGAAWLRPDFVSAEGQLAATVQIFVICLPATTIVVDPGVGNGKRRTAVPGWDGLHTDCLDQLRAAGVAPAAVDHVINTHLHFDHVGGNTRWIDGRWEPTFPAARYVMSAAEFAYWRAVPKREIADQHAGFADSVWPVVENGSADLVPDDHAINEQVRLLPTPGHTPHHVSVLIESAGASAILLGDVMHHPCQIAHPEWGAVSDFDPTAARISRRAVVERCADTDMLVLGAHFADPVAGRIRRHGDDIFFDTASRGDREREAPTR